VFGEVGWLAGCPECIPVFSKECGEIPAIICDTLEELQLDPQTRQELLRWYDVITHQNYFSNNGEILIQEDGLTMGAPTSGLLA